ncbi:iron chaperone [Thalassoglobus sp.]|uniref:iron chaperone n=1 Tax=Thalassoglobus sp. TaxID=2795869 RepID=UPI003AA84A37
MAKKSYKTIPEYIEAAPPEGQPQLRQLHALLQSIAPEAEQVIKWNTPFFVEPRFLFAFSAHKSHLGFNAMAESIEPFRDELSEYEITKMGILKIPYTKPLPEKLIRKIAEHRMQMVRERDDASFW